MKIFIFCRMYSDGKSFATTAKDEDDAIQKIENMLSEKGIVRIIPASEKTEVREGQGILITPAMPERRECDIPGWPGEYICWSFDEGEVLQFPPDGVPIG